jgi:hypothetical protein
VVIALEAKLEGASLLTKARKQKQQKHIEARTVAALSCGTAEDAFAAQGLQCTQGAVHPPDMQAECPAH